MVKLFLMSTSASQPASFKNSCFVPGSGRCEPCSQDELFDKILHAPETVIFRFNEAKAKNPTLAESARKAYGLGFSLVWINPNGLNEEQIAAYFKQEVIPPILDFVNQEGIVRAGGLTPEELVIAYFINELETTESVNWNNVQNKDKFEAVLAKALDFNF